MQSSFAFKNELNSFIFVAGEVEEDLFIGIRPAGESAA